MGRAVGIIVALVFGYFYAATRNWVWIPGWLKRFVLDEKKRAQPSAH
jgi:hypothetical protein